VALASRKLTTAMEPCRERLGYRDKQGAGERGGKAKKKEGWGSNI